MKKIVLVGLLVSAGIAFFISPFASSFPDGLEKVAEAKGFIHKAEGKDILKSPIPDYTLPGIKNEILAVALSGFIGVVITFFSALVFGYMIKTNNIKG